MLKCFIVYVVALKMHSLTEVNNEVCVGIWRFFLKLRNGRCVGKLTLMNLACLLVFAFCAGCAVNNSSHSSLKTGSTSMDDLIPLQLSKRIELYWGYRSSKNFKDSYKIEAFHTRYQIGYDKYLKLFENSKPISAVELTSADCSENRCLLIVDLEFSGLQKKGQRIKDYWILQEGQWYHVVQDILRKIY